MAMNPRLLRPLASGFSPKQIAGLNLWIDFSDTATVTLDGSNKVAGVLDKSGLSQHGTQPTSAKRLGVSAINGRQCADNGTSSNSFCVTYATGSNNNNWRDTFVVAQWDAGGSTFPAFNSAISAAASTGTNSGSMLVGSSGSRNWYGSSVMIGTGRAWQTNGGPILTGSSSSHFEAFDYFGSAFVFRGNAQSDVGVDGWQLGSDRTLAGRGWLGRIGEVLSFNRSLTTAESQKVEGYLAWKWGLQAQLPYDHPYAKSFPGFGSQTTPTDPDAQTYLAAVAAADGTGVEVGVANAVDDFVKGCKSDGIWDAIKASCILAGARTLAGALVPLVGTAPTNNNFVSGDYDRETGLVGDGSTKYLDSNRAGDADGQNDLHFAVYISEAHTGAANGAYLASGNLNQTASSGLYRGGGGGAHTYRIRGQGISQATTPPGAFAGVRVDATTAVAYGDAVNTNASAASTAAYANNWWVFGNNSSGTTNQYPCDGRIAFYSVGSAISDDTLLTRIADLITAIGAAI